MKFIKVIRIFQINSYVFELFLKHLSSSNLEIYLMKSFQLTKLHNNIIQYFIHLWKLGLELHFFKTYRLFYKTVHFIYRKV